MGHLLVRPSFAASLALFAAAIAVSAQSLGPSTNARPSIRVTAKVDSQVTSVLAGTHPVFKSNTVLGARVAASKSLPHLKLVLTSSPDQEAALATLMIEQQDKSSPNYHHWLTPDTFGTEFGPAAADIAKVTAWLQDQGFSVESVARSGRVVTFSGNAGQVEAAFKTQISSIQMDGQTYFSNTTDISIPQALAPVVAGIARINDIFPKHVANHSRVSTVQLDAAGNGYAPLYGAATGTHYVTPGDVATIYNTTPLTSAGIDGTGQTVGIIAQSNIDLADVEEFRSMFGLKKNDPTVIVVGQDPGENQDDTEAYLDAEWGGAAASGAGLDFIVSGPSLEDGGVDGAALYAVENNAVDIISLSYGGGESSNGASGTAYWNTLWEQAASQGQTVFVSSGDSGAAGCDSSGNTYERGGYCVNALGSSAFNVAMGGSIFIDWNPAQYWSATGGTTIPFANALSYIPEGVVNQGRLSNDELNSASSAYLTGSGIFSDGGGISIYTARPSWQTGTGIPTNTDVIGTITGTGIAPGSPIAGLHRLVPDLVNISANGHDGTLFCAGSLCSVTNAGGLYDAGIVGGTSVATPVQAGMQALINEKNGGRQGNILPILYSLSNAQYSASTTACQAAIGTTTTSTPTLPASTCNFHDVIAGSNIVASASSGTAGIGFTAQAGFDEASGLGSMNVANVANNWSSVSMTATTTTFTLSPTAGVTHGGIQNLTASVVPNTGTGTPTGDVSLIASTTTPNGPRTYALSGGVYSGTVAGGSTNVASGENAALPAGSYSVYVHYAGDGTFAPSDSAAISVDINKEGSAVSVSPYNVTTGGAVNLQTTFAYGADVYLDTFVTATSNSGSPTGTVTYSLARNGAAYGAITTSLDSSGNTYFMSGQAFISFYLKPNFAALSPGSYVATITYAGDSTFNTSSTTVSFTVTQLTPGVSFVVPTTIASGANAVIAYSIANPASQGNMNTTVPATGTVTFSDTTTATTLGACTLSSALTPGSTLPSAVCSFSTTAITTAGANNIAAVYSGDTNYAAATTNATATVGTAAAATLTLTGSGTATVGAIYDLIATMNPATATGTVSFYDGATLLGIYGLASGSTTAALGTAANGYGILTAGSHSFSATYSGSPTYASSTGTLSTTIAKNTTGIFLSAPSASVYGSPVVMSVFLTRTVSTGATYPALIQPTGVVNFYDSTVSTTIPIAIGTLRFDPAGYGYYAAAGTSTAIPAGSNTITATYVGDGNFTGSTSTLTPVVSIAAQTPVITLLSPSTIYNGTTSIVLTASIPGTSLLAAPSGVITFYDGNTSVGTANASYNPATGTFTATTTLTGVAGGTHTYQAVLSADSNYTTATSNMLPILLNTNYVWIANGNHTISGLTNSGTAITSTAQSGGGTAIAIDNAGDIWSLNKSASAVSEYSNGGVLSSGGITVGGLNAPTALAIDGAGLVWVTNGNGTLSVLSSPTTAVSGAAYMVSGATPTSITIDASGNLWITNAGDNSVSEVLGAATPVVTPTVHAVASGTLAARP